MRHLLAAQESQTYRQVAVDQEWSTHSPLFSWDNTYPGVELLLSRLDPSDSSHAAAVRTNTSCSTAARVSISLNVVFGHLDSQGIN